MAGTQYFDSIGAKRGHSTFEVPNARVVFVAGVDKEAPADEYPEFVDRTAPTVADPRLVKSMRKRGQREPVEVFRCPQRGIFIVHSGRGRVFAMRKLHDELDAEGVEFKPPLKLVRWLPPDGAKENKLVVALDVADSNIRVDRTPMALADQVAFLKSQHASDEQICEAFGWTATVSVKNYMRLHDLAPCVQAWCRLGRAKGGCSQDLALAFEGKTEAEAKALIATLKELKLTKGERAKDIVRGRKIIQRAPSAGASKSKAESGRGDNPPRARSRAKRVDMLERLQKHPDHPFNAAAIFTLLWCDGLADEMKGAKLDAEPVKVVAPKKKRGRPATSASSKKSGAKSEDDDE